MPRAATISYDQVVRYAEAIKGEGGKPTPRQIRERCVFHLKSAKHSDRNTAIYNDALPATDFDAKTATYSEQNPPARRVSKRGIGVRIRPRRVGVSPAASASTLPSTRSADYR